MAKGIKLTKDQQQYIVLAILVLGGGGFSFIKYFWMPTSEKIVTTGKEIEKIVRRINKAKGQAGRLKRIQLEIEKLNEQAEDAERRLPKEQDLPSVIDTVSELSRKFNVSLVSFSPGGPSAQAHFIEVPYQMTTKASYHDLGRFLAALALEERIFNVRNINYGTPADGKLSVSMTLISYQYKG
jgi:Tfp pilus assembly protein PilO